MKNLLKKIDGYKTYTVALAMALYAIIFIGWYSRDWPSAFKLLLEAMAMAGLRHAI